MLKATLLTAITAATLIFMPASAHAEAPVVAADIAPVHGLVAMVMQGIGQPKLILPQGADPHHHAMRPSEARALSQAALVFQVGPTLTPWLDGALENLASDAKIISLMEVPGSTVLPMRHGAGFQDHDDHSGHGHGDKHGDKHGGHGHHGHSDKHGDSDPHAWLAPENAIVWLDAIATALAKIDPDNAAAYATNALRGQVEITTLADEIRAEFAPLEGLKYLVYHDSLQYFEHSFAQPALAAVTSGHAARPGPARLASLRALVAEQGIGCLLAGPETSSALIENIFEGTNLRLVRMDPLGNELALGQGFYPNLLRGLASALQECR